MTRAIHDALFKRVFSDTENARSFLKEVLPTKVAARLEWGSLDRRPESYADEVPRSKYSDFVFSVRLRGERRALVYILFDHQREADDVMPRWHETGRSLRFSIRRRATRPPE
jgi:predicted transposase YdaD